MSETKSVYTHGAPEPEPLTCPTCGAPASREVIDLQVPPQMIPGEPPTFIPYPKYIYAPIGLDALERAVVEAAIDRYLAELAYAVGAGKTGVLSNRIAEESFREIGVVHALLAARAAEGREGGT